MVLQDFVKQVASSPLQMDKDESVHRRTDPAQQNKQVDKDENVYRRTDPVQQNKQSKSALLVPAGCW